MSPRSSTAFWRIPDDVSVTQALTDNDICGTMVPPWRSGITVVAFWNVIDGNGLTWIAEGW